MGQNICFDGLNLSLDQGTGIATYAKLLTSVTRVSSATRSASWAAQSNARRRIHSCAKLRCLTCSATRGWGEGARGL